MRAYFQYLEYPVGNRAYGGGGWSKNAKHKPAPEIREGFCEAIPANSRGWIVNGVRKLKLNLWDIETGNEIRRDYPNIKTPEWMSDPLKRAVASGQEEACRMSTSKFHRGHLQPLSGLFKE